MDSTERIVRTWMGSGRDLEVEEIIQGAQLILLELCSLRPCEPHYRHLERSDYFNKHCKSPR